MRVVIILILSMYVYMYYKFNDKNIISDYKSEHTPQVILFRSWIQLCIKSDELQTVKL